MTTKSAILSIRQPWAWAIVNGYKPVENRVWKPYYTGPLLIHAGKSEDRDSVPSVLSVVAEQIEETENYVELYNQYTTEKALGAIIGRVQICGCANSLSEAEQIMQFCENADLLRNWWQGPYGFLLKDQVAFEHPIPLCGRLGIWWEDVNVPDLHN